MRCRNPGGVATTSAPEADHRSLKFLDGVTLTHRIGGAPLAVEAILEIGQDIASALSAAHAKGIVHRDIKPANIFVTADGRAKVLDFGVAKLTMPEQSAGDALTIAAARATAAHVTVGTLAYMSPEQARGEPLDARTDLFSLGAVLYEMCTGVAPFRGATDAALLDAVLHAEPVPPIRINPSIPPELDAVVTKALEKGRRLRYQHASDMQADLARLTRATATQKFAAAPVARRRRNWRWSAAVIAVVVMLAAAFAWRGRNVRALGEADVIVLTDIVNHTGDAVFDGTLRQAVAVKLGESPFLNVFSDARMRETLRFMNQPIDARVTPEIGRDMCRRRQLKAMLTGDIAAVGRNYAVSRSTATSHSPTRESARSTRTCSSRRRPWPIGPARSSCERGRASGSVTTSTRRTTRMSPTTLLGPRHLRAVEADVPARRDAME